MTIQIESQQLMFHSYLGSKRRKSKVRQSVERKFLLGPVGSKNIKKPPILNGGPVTEKNSMFWKPIAPQCEASQKPPRNEFWAVILKNQILLS